MKSFLTSVANGFLVHQEYNALSLRAHDVSRSRISKKKVLTLLKVYLHKIAPNARKLLQCPTVPNKHRRTVTFSWFFQ